MLHGLEALSEVEAQRTIAAAPDDLHSPNHRGFVVDSPAGDGRLALVVPTAIEQAAAGGSLPIIARPKEGVDHLVDLLMTKAIAATADEAA